MPREILRFPYSVAEIILLEYPNEWYQIDIYWHEGGYYEQLTEIENSDPAREVYLKISKLLIATTLLVELRYYSGVMPKS